MSRHRPSAWILAPWLAALLCNVGGSYAFAATDCGEDGASGGFSGDNLVFAAPEATIASDPGPRHAPAAAYGTPAEQFQDVTPPVVTEDCDVGPVACAPPLYLVHCAFLC